MRGLFVDLRREPRPVVRPTYIQIHIALDLCSVYPVSDKLASVAELKQLRRCLRLLPVRRYDVPHVFAIWLNDCCCASVYPHVPDV